MSKDEFGQILRRPYKNVYIDKWLIKGHLHDKEEHQFRILKWDEVIPSCLAEQTVMAKLWVSSGKFWEQRVRASTQKIICVRFLK